jgi:hypothetical protein
VAIDCRTFRIPIKQQDCTVVQIDTKPPLFYIQGYGCVIIMEEKRFSIEEIRNYIKSKDSLGDVMYYLSESEIEKANDIPDEGICCMCGNKALLTYAGGSGYCDNCI